MCFMTLCNLSLTDNACLFVEDHNPDPTLHLKHTSEDDESDNEDEDTNSGNDSDQEMKKRSINTMDQEVDSGSEGVGTEEDVCSERRGDKSEATVKVKRTKSKKYAVREGEEESGSRYKIRRDRLLQRRKKISIQGRIKSLKRRSLHASIND